MCLVSGSAVLTVPPLRQVFYVDYGSVTTVPREVLRFLPERFFGLPAQALLVGAAGGHSRAACALGRGAPSQGAPDATGG